MSPLLRLSFFCLLVVLLSTAVQGRPRRDVSSDGELLEYLHGEESSVISHRDRRNSEVDYADDQDTVTKAIEYYQMVIKEHACAEPQPRVLPVQELYPRSEMSYATMNVALYRCAYDSGCCQLNEICAPKTKQIIHLPILMFNSEKLVEIMPFVNHTQCHCVPRKEHVDD